MIDWINKNKFIVILFVMLIIWSSIFLLFYLKTDEITKDPCSICAERLNENVICYSSGFRVFSKTFYTDGNIKLDEQKSIEDVLVNQ
jgi:hypothetical protein